MKAAAARDAGGAPVADASDTAYKERVRDMWAKRGANYDTNNTFHPPLCEQLVALAGIRPGAAVLDVATGTGNVAFSAAAAVGPSGRVVGVDISDAMLQQARAKLGAAAGAAGIEFLLQDVEAADFPDGSFEFILCSNGMAYMQHMAATAAQFRRWLKPGGVLAFNNPLSPMIPLTDVIRAAARTLDFTDAEFPDAGATLGDEHRIRELLTGAGFSNIQVTQSDEEKVWADTMPEALADTVFEMMRSFPTAPMDLQLTTEQTELLRSSYMPEAVAMASAWRRGADAVLPFKMLWAVATA